MRTDESVEHALERIVVVPVNGYVNRLQAWASAAILGAELDVPVQVLWEPEDVAPAPAESLFDETRLRVSFVAPDVVTALAGRPHQELPRYLTLDRERGVIVLAGHDLGEQAFMDALIEALGDASEPHTLLIIAGGKFSLPGTEDAAELRREVFYERMDWHPSIRERVDAVLAGRDAFIGLHIRETDRSREAPTRTAVREALADAAARTGLTSIFIAADTPAARDEWSGIAVVLGLEPWTSGDIAFDRSQVNAGIDAIVDWIVLGHSQLVVHSAESSFGQEAAIATGKPDDSVALAASAIRRRLRSALAFMKSVATRPGRLDRQ